MGEWGLEVRRADGRREASVPRRNRPFLPQLLVMMVAAAVPWSLLLLLLLCRVWSGSERALWRSRRGRQWHDARGGARDRTILVRSETTFVTAPK